MLGDQRPTRADVGLQVQSDIVELTQSTEPLLHESNMRGVRGDRGRRRADLVSCQNPLWRQRRHRPHVQEPNPRSEVWWDDHLASRRRAHRRAGVAGVGKEVGWDTLQRYAESWFDSTTRRPRWWKPSGGSSRAGA